MDESEEHEVPTLAEKMMFDANLAEFGHRAGLICALEAGGKISQQGAFQQIKALWKQLKGSSKTLRIREAPRDAGQPPQES